MYRQRVTPAAMNKARLQGGQRRQKLQQLLIIRVKNRYTKKAPWTPGVEQFVATEVDDLLDRGHPAEADLARIASRALSLNKKKSASKTAADMPIQQQVDEVSMQEDEYHHVDQSSESAVSAKQDLDVWAALTKLEMAKHRQELERTVQRKRDSKFFLKRELDEQVKEKNSRAAEEAAVDAEYVEFEEREVKQYLNQEDRRKKNRKEAELAERRARDEQLAELERRRQEEDDARRSDEAQQVAGIRKELEMERQKELNKKKRQKDELQSAIEFNIISQKAKGEQRALEKEEEQRIQRQYAESVEKQERDRQEALERLFARQQRNMELNMKVQNSLHEKEVMDAERAERQAIEMFQKQDQEEARKRGAREAEKREMRRVLSEQVAYTQELRRRELEEERVMGEKFKEDAEKYGEEQAKIREKKRRSKISTREALRKQMDECAQRKREEDMSMSPNEKLMNSQLLGEVFRE